MSAYGVVFLQMAALAAALSLDAFFAGLGYGAAGIRPQKEALWAASGCCAGVLMAGMLLGGLLGPLFPPRWAVWAGALALALLGCGKIGGGALKRRIRRAENRQLSFRMLSFRCILQVYADPALADADGSRSLSLPEGLALGAALSMDGAAAGVGAGLTGGDWRLAGLLTFGMTAAFLAGGALLGRRLCRAGKAEMDWLGGGILLALAFARLLG